VDRGRRRIVGCNRLARSHRLSVDREGKAGPVPAGARMALTHVLNALSEWTASSLSRGRGRRRHGARCLPSGTNLKKTHGTGSFGIVAPRAGSPSRGFPGGAGIGVCRRDPFVGEKGIQGLEAGPRGVGTFPLRRDLAPDLSAGSPRGAVTRTAPGRTDKTRMNGQYPVGIVPFKPRATTRTRMVGELPAQQTAARQAQRPSARGCQNAPGTSSSVK